MAGAARPRRRARGADRGAAKDRRPPAKPDRRAAATTVMTLNAQRLHVEIGDLVEIEGNTRRLRSPWRRCYPRSKHALLAEGSSRARSDPVPRMTVASRDAPTPLGRSAECSLPSRLGGGVAMPARAPGCLAASRAGGSVLVDRSEREGALTPRPRQVVVVILRAPGLRLKPLAAQAEATREVMELLERVRLQVPATGPSSPITHLEGVIHVDAQVNWPTNGSTQGVPTNERGRFLLVHTGAQSRRRGSGASPVQPSWGLRGANWPGASPDRRA